MNKSSHLTVINFAMAASLENAFTCFYYTSLCETCSHICLNSGKGYSYNTSEIKEYLYYTRKKNKKTGKSSLLSSILLGTFCLPKRLQQQGRMFLPLSRLLLMLHQSQGSATSLPLASLPVNVPSAFTLKLTVSGATTLVVPTIAIIWLFCDTIALASCSGALELLVLHNNRLSNNIHRWSFRVLRCFACPFISCCPGLIGSAGLMNQLLEPVSQVLPELLVVGSAGTSGTVGVGAEALPPVFESLLRSHHHHLGLLKDQLLHDLSLVV